MIFMERLAARLCYIQDDEKSNATFPEWLEYQGIALLEEDNKENN